MIGQTISHYRIPEKLGWAAAAWAWFTRPKTVLLHRLPSDPAEVEFIGPVAEAEVYVYGVRQLLSDLYPVEGLR
jgi:hypothetical protein